MKARGLLANSEGMAFNKGRVAKRMMEDLAKKTIKDLPRPAIEAFRALFLTVNKAMPGLASASGPVTESPPKG